MVKLILEEPESAALAKAIADWPELVSSALAEVEVVRAIGRALERIQAGVRPDHIATLRGELLARTEAVLGRVGLIAIEERILKSAAQLGPPALRSLDAIHLATALDLGDLEAMVAYDPRLSSAGRVAGLNVLAP